MNTSPYLNSPARSEVDAAADRQRALDRFVQQNVLCCLSGIVSTLAESCHGVNPDDTVASLCEQASDLAAPIPDYESAAREAGWEVERSAVFEGQAAPWTAKRYVNGYMQTTGDADTSIEAWRDACDADDIDPADDNLFHEPFEFWAVSAYLALELEKHGEKVDRDFEGLCVWARTTTGQTISMDGVIQRIYAELMSA